MISPKFQGWHRLLLSDTVWNTYLLYLLIQVLHDGQKTGWHHSEVDIWLFTKYHFMTFSFNFFKDNMDSCVMTKKAMFEGHCDH